jgi:pimeloyl-ACP methyl ester carboxylesterase
MLFLPTESESAPQWFVDALADPGELSRVEVRGAMVEYRVWGPKGAPVVVLIHGGAAHGGWWDHLAPSMAVSRRIVAVDLTGHGSSDRRGNYDFLTWADEIYAVAVAEGSPRPNIVGHSMGGVVALAAASRYHENIRGAVVIDPPGWLVCGDGLASRPLGPSVRRFHSSRELAAERFRARPLDSSRLDFVERHVAHRSVHLTDDGWTWRFDPNVTLHDTFPESLWGGERGPLTLVLAERGLLAPPQVDQLLARIGPVNTRMIPDAGHHVMLDQPLALLNCLEDVLRP